MSFDALMKKPSLPRHFHRLEAYFEGSHRLDAIGVSLPPEVRILELVLDWPRITVESLEERLTVEGFALAGEEASDDHYWSRWQANRLDMQAPLVHTEAFVQGVGYAVVGPPASGEWAKVTVHSALGFATVVDPWTGRITEAVQRFKEADGSLWAMHYAPGVNTRYGKVHGVWKQDAAVASGTSRVPVVPFLNRSRIRDHLGRSEMLDVMRYTDAASRSVTQLQVAGEILALPQRYLFSDKAKEMMTGSDGKAVTQWEAYIGRLLTGPGDAKAGQFDGADLAQLISTVRLYAGLTSASTGLSMDTLGFASEANPTSAEALNAIDNRHVRKAEKKQVFFGEAWEDVMRIADEIEGRDTPENARLETRWRDAATPTIAAKADAAAKLVGAGIIPPAVGRDMVGLTPEQKRMATEYDASFDGLARAVGA